MGLGRIDMEGLAGEGCDGCSCFCSWLRLFYKSWRSFWLYALAGGGSRVVAPAGDSLSFASPKESKPRKSDPTGCVPSLRCGQPAVLSFAGVSLNSRRFASLKQTRALIRQNLRSSAHPEGNPKPDIHTGHCCARPKPPGRKRHALRRLGRAQQWPVWLFGCRAVRLPTPFWLRLRRSVCGVAWAPSRACFVI